MVHRWPPERSGSARRCRPQLRRRRHRHRSKGRGCRATCRSPTLPRRARPVGGPDLRRQLETIGSARRAAVEAPRPRPEHGMSPDERFGAGGYCLACPVHLLRKAASMTRLLAALVAVIGVLALAGGASAKPVPVNSFTDFTVAATPPNPAGTNCPGSPLCYNGAAEPAIGVTPTGRFYASSENGLGGGTLAWTSADNGLHYTSTPSPNDVSTGSGSVGKDSGLEPGGGDTDVAIATAPNAQGNYNAYVVSLTVVNIDVSTSTDNGVTWSLNPAAALPIDDRPWAAA